MSTPDAAEPAAEPGAAAAASTHTSIRVAVRARPLSQKEKDAGGLVGEQANLALVGMNASHKKPKRDKWYVDKGGDDGDD